MVERIRIGQGKSFLYKYKGKQYKILELLALPECIVNKTTLFNRINSYFNGRNSPHFQNLEDMLTKKAFNRVQAQQKIKAPQVEISEVEKWIRDMPVSSLYKEALSMSAKYYD